MSRHLLILGLATAAALLHGCGPGGGTQTTPCTQGARQCAPDGASVELCNLTNGSFETLEACDADEVCGDYQGTTACAPASCTPNKRFCHDGDVWDCTPAGEPSRVQADCAAGQLCVVDAGVAQCADVTCTPGQTRCAADGSGVQECTADGARFEPTQSCADGQVCQQNGNLTECVDDAVCTPGQRRCAADGSGVEACAADGSGFATEQTCGAEETCTTPAGNPTCTSDVSCTPGERRCAPDGSRVEFCGSTGRGYVGGGDCAADEACGDFGGDILCAPTSCERNKRFCLSGDVWNCSAAGAPTGVQAECAAGQACIIDAGVSQCADVTCVPGELRCSAAGDGVQVCADDGTGFVPRTACGADQTCETTGDFARCVDVLECQFGERRCVGAQQERCDASGTFVPDPCASDEVCAVVAGNPTCVDAVSCTPGERRCAPDGSRVEVCGPTGDRYVGFGNCDADETCGDFQGTIACAPTTCSANDRFCFDGDVWDCSAAGAPSRVQDECALGEACVVDAGVSQCAPVVCVPGSTRCSPAGDGIEVCDTDGTGFAPSSTCGADEVCALAGAVAVCQPEAQCATGTSRCDATNGGVEACNSAGLYDPATPCAQGTVCVQNGARAACEQPIVCQAGALRCAASGARLEVCRADGTAFNPSTPCAQDESCTLINGAPTCAPASCPANTNFCAGRDVWSCDASGAPDALVTTCAPGEACVDAGGAATCQQVVCTPGVTRCAQGDGSVEICAPDGTGYVTDTQCAGAEVCVDDFNAPRCEAPRVCAAGSLRCVTSGDAIEACAQDESGYLLDVDCPAGEICVDDASGVRCTSPVAPPVCTPGELACADSSTVELCQADGQFAPYSTCAANEECEESGDSAACIPQPVCVQGATRCSAAGDAAEVCAPDRLSFDTAESCDPGETCQLLSGGAQCAPASCTANRRFCHEGDVWSCNAQSRPNGVFDACDPGDQCLRVAGVFQCVAIICQPGEQRCNAAGDAVEECDAIGSGFTTVQSCGGTEICSAGNGVGECVDGSVNCQAGFRYSGGQCVDIDECADGIAQCDAICQNTPGGFDCVSSVADMSSPYWQFSCPLGQQLSSPTGLEADCRCGTNQSLTGGLEPCWRPFEAYTRAPAFDFGQGPRPGAHPQVEIRGGVFDAAAREIIAAVDWSGSNDPDAGFVMAFDVDTRARRVVSGRHLSGGAPTTRGAGPAFADVRDVREGAGGLLYVLQGTLTRTEILSVDPSTGDRALVWERDGAGFGQCDNGRGSGSVQIRAEGFAIGAAGQFYLGFANTGSLGEGIGIVEVAADGSTCAFVTRSGSGAQNAYANQPVGSGPAFTSGELRGYAIRGGELYTLNNFDLRMVAVDLATGARRVVSSASSTSPVGSGPQNSGGIGHRWATWDASRGVWWTTGRQGDTQIILVEPGSGDRHDLYCPGGASSFAGAACVEGSLASGLSLNFGGSWLDPQDPDVVYFAHDSMGIVKYEVSTGNSLIWSL